MSGGEFTYSLSLKKLRNWKISVKYFSFFINKKKKKLENYCNALIKAIENPQESPLFGGYLVDKKVY